MIRTVTCACLGALLGLFASSLLRGSPPNVFAAVAMAVAGVLVSVIAVAQLAGTLDRSRRPTATHARQAWGTPPSPPRNPFGEPGNIPEVAPYRPPHSDRSAAPLSPARPVEAPEPPVAEEPPPSAAVHLRNWWSDEQAVSDGGATAHPDVNRDLPAPPDTSAYGRSRRVVQCLQCASLRINLQQSPDGPHFTCARCGLPWSWRPGSPWPTVTSGMPPRPSPSVDAF